MVKYVPSILFHRLRLLSRSIVVVQRCSMEFRISLGFVGQRSGYTCHDASILSQKEHDILIEQLPFRCMEQCGCRALSA